MTTPAKNQWPAITVLLLGAALNLFIVLFNHYNYRTFAYYYGVYNFAFFDFAHLRCDPVPMLFDGTNSNFMQDHFSLLIPLLSPLYWPMQFVAGTYFLLVVQWLCIVAGGWATMQLVAARSGDRWLPAAAVFAYFAFYSRYASYVADCNLAIMGSSLIPLFLYFFHCRKMVHAIATFVLLVLTRENFPVWLAFICVYLAIEYRKDRALRPAALWLAAVALASFIIILKWVIPSFETENVRFVLFNYTALGPDPGTAAKFVFAHPLDTIRLFFVNQLSDHSVDDVKTRFYIVFALSAGWLLLLRPHTLLCLVPVMAVKMLNDDPIRWGYESYYGIEATSIIPVLAFPVIGAMRKSAARYVTAAFTVALLATVTAYCFRESYYPHMYTKIEFFNPDYYRSDLDVKRVNEAIAAIPADARVCASGRFIPHLAYRKRTYYFPLVRDADYLCVSKYGDSWPLTNEAFTAALDSITRVDGFRQYFTSGSVAFYRRQRTSIPQR